MKSTNPSEVSQVSFHCYSPLNEGSAQPMTCHGCLSQINPLLFYRRKITRGRETENNFGFLDSITLFCLCPLILIMTQQQPIISNAPLRSSTLFFSPLPPTHVPPPGKESYGRYMLTIPWNRVSGWGQAHIAPRQDLSFDPLSGVLQYAVTCFEGMKVRLPCDLVMTVRLRGE